MTAKSDKENIEDILSGYWLKLKRFPKEFYSFYRHEVPSWLRNQVFTKGLKSIEDLPEEEKNLYWKLRTQASDTFEADKIREKEPEGVA